MIGIKALVSIGGFDFPEPSSYRAISSTIVDSGRNAGGTVIGAVVRNDVAKIDMSWKYLTADQWARILTLFAKSFYNDVCFLNQTTNSFDERKFYVSDRNADMWRRHPVTGEVLGYVNCTLSLVEV